MNPTNQPPPEEARKKDGLPPISPDFIEQDYPETLDNIIPTSGYQITPMVGIGGSAGGIQALTEFFKAMPADSGMTFVVILHLSPKHVSTLPDLLARVTSMKVVEAEEGQKVEPNHVYVIPPAKYLATVNGQLKLTEMEKDRGKRAAVDLFFRSLADTHGPQALAIVLSGVDGDGALGIRRIKERGGLTIAQDPDEAEHGGMPRTSIETGMVDWVLRVAEMPGRLMAYTKNRERLKLPPEDGPPAAPAKRAPDDAAEIALRDVLVFLRMRTGHDFSYYKRATILRRIGRRMQVNGVDDLPGYLEFLRTHPGEPTALLQDLLISVTNFFRDRDVWEAVAKQIPELFKDKTSGDLVRVWVPACATGEEAYSIAMLLLEHARKLDAPPTLQVFACDLDEQAIQTARAGLYSEVIAADVSEERLRRFFVKELHNFRVKRELREMVLFAVHDLLKDAPFSRMDMVSCRNLLIYLNDAAQHRVFETLHFALKPHGRLVLGASESAEDAGALFSSIDKKHRIYVREPSIRIGLPVPSGPTSLLRAIQVHEEAATAPVVHGKNFVPEAPVAFPAQSLRRRDRASLAELHFRLVERYAPPSVIVNADEDIVHISEHAGAFLKVAGGEPTHNLLRVVNPNLRVALRTTLFRAAETNAPAESFDVPADIEGQNCVVDIRVAPAPEIAPGYRLVMFEKRSSPRKPAQAGEPPLPPEPLLRHLERELEQVKAHLRDTVEQYEGSTEELKANNEELQAMNEELRSATEELETSREELQSINEELSTVNQEMKAKVDELAHTNSDLQNLMASTAIATVFLDRDLAIMRYTPSAVSIFHMIPTDVGRPLAHLKHHLEYPELIADAAKVLDTLVPVEREVRGDGHSYLARVQPYRSQEDHIAGVVLTLIDVTERNRVVEALRESEERMRMLLESAKEYAIFTTDRERRVDSWNTGAETMFGYSGSEILGKSADLLFTPEDRARGDPEREMQTAMDKGRAGNERWHARKNGSTFFGYGSVMPLRDRSGELRGFLKIMADLTENKRTQEALREQMDELARFNAAAVGRESRMIELKKEVNDLCARNGEKPRYKIEPE
jgi:two-component system CheB/CheR fusion protein